MRGINAIQRRIIADAALPCAAEPTGGGNSEVSAGQMPALRGLVKRGLVAMRRCSDCAGSHADITDRGMLAARIYDATRAKVRP